MSKGSNETKKHAPSQRRLREARERGQVAKSVELASALSLLVGLFGTLSLTPWASRQLTQTCLASFQAIEQGQTQAAASLALESLHMLLVLSLPPLLLASTTYIVSLWTQTGVVFSPELLKPKLEHVNPVNGFRRLFSLRSAVQIGFMLVRAIVVGTAALLAAMHIAGDAIRVIHAGTDAALVVAGAALMNLLLWCGGLFALLGLLDLAYQRWHMLKELRMAHSEVKREQIEDQGNPQMKAQRRRQQDEAPALERLAQIRYASLLIQDANRRVIALVYRREYHDVPLVIVRGADVFADRMLADAVAHDIPCARDERLVAQLYPYANPGAAVPAALIDSVLAHLPRTPSNSGAPVPPSEDE